MEGVPRDGGKMSDSNPPTDEVDMLLSRIPQPATPDGPCIDDGVLAAYNAKTLEDEETNAIDRHLATCRDCRLLLAHLSRGVPEALTTWAEGRMPSKKRRRVRVLVSSAMAAAASIVFAMFGVEALMKKPSVIPTYAITKISGGVARTRGANEAPSDLFLPYSRIAIAIESDEKVMSVPDVRVYTSCGEERLSAVKSLVAPDGEGGFHMDAKASDLFGTSFGRCFVHFLLTSKEGPAPPDLSGRTVEEALKSAGVHRWVRAELRYVEKVEQGD
jgi:hypothetical protein